MALSYVEGADSRQNLGFSMIIQLNVATPAASDYPTGGYPMYSSAGSATNAGQYFGMGLLHGISVIGYTGTAINYIWHYNKTTAKLQVFNTTTGAPSNLVEVAANTDLSGGTVSLLAWGF